MIEKQSSDLNYTSYSSDLMLEEQEEKDHSSSSSEGSKHPNSGEESENEAPVQSLVVGRAKRATAGNRLSVLVDKEQDDEIGLLFAESGEEEDESFEEDDDAASDANMGDSTSDEEDKEQAKGADDLAGERELQKQARLEKRKRKAKDMAKMTGMARKKVKIDPTAVQAPAAAPPRAKRKSERISWVATEADAPTRISSRKQTVQNREVVHQRLVNSEKQRIKVMRQMEEAQKRKDAMKPKALTQAQRLEEAAKMERRNAKSLNRWEESEKQRAAEQKAKLEALHNRQLSGPVISWWSGLARWVDEKVAQLGVKEVRAAGHKEEPVTVIKDSVRPKLSQDSRLSQDDAAVMARDIPPKAKQKTAQPPVYANYPPNPYAQPVQFVRPQGLHGFLDGIHAYAALPATQQRAEFTGTADGGLLATAPPPPPPPSTVQDNGPEGAVRKERDVRYTSRNLVALKNVDANAQKVPEIQNSVLVKKKGGSRPQSELDTVAAEDDCTKSNDCVND